MSVEFGCTHCKYSLEETDEIFYPVVFVIILIIIILIMVLSSALCCPVECGNCCKNGEYVYYDDSIVWRTVWKYEKKYISKISKFMCHLTSLN